MKKIFFETFIMLILFANVHAQEKMKIAVMDFKPGVGVTEAEVNGLSEMLITALFETSKFTIVERTQLDKAITEQGFQKLNLSAGEIAKVGKILGVKSVLIGTVNFIATERTTQQVETGMITGEYNIDVRIVDVESGEIVSSAGVTKNSSKTYRDLMPTLAENLTKKIISTDGGQVVKLLGYLYVFPEDIGEWTYEDALKMCANVNAGNLNGYNDWRIPTVSELQLIYTYKSKFENLQTGSSCCDGVYLSKDEYLSYGTTYSGQKCFSMGCGNALYYYKNYNNVCEDSYYISKDSKAHIRLVRTDKQN